MTEKKHHYTGKFLINIFFLCLAAVFCFTSCAGTPAVTAATSESTHTGATSASTAQTLASSTAASTDAPVVKPTKKQVAITFDDGPHNIYTVAIANELAKYGFHATFFLIGDRVDGTQYNGMPALKTILAQGNEIGIHGYTHTVHYDDCTPEEYAEEMGSTLAAIKKASPEYKVTLMRPIGGRISDERAKASEYSIILWNVDSEDWRYKYAEGDSDQSKQEKVDTIVENVMSDIDDGSIVLMHDIYESTFDAVKLLLERLDAEGYEVVTVSELLGKPKPGVKYSSR